MPSQPTLAPSPRRIDPTDDACPPREDPQFSLRATRDLIRDLFRPDARIYWADFLITTTIAYSATLAYLRGPWGLGIKSLLFVVAGLALFRNGTFIHEIAHMRKGTFRGFRTAWNMIVGIPLFMPSYLYGNHADHHRWRHYGTRHDGEYLPLARGPVRQIAFYTLEILLLPLLAFVRALVLVPISFCHPKLRTWLLERFSSYVLNFGYRRPLREHDPRRLWALADVGCFLSAAGFATIVVTGQIPWNRPIMCYALGAFSVGLNWLRNLAAHRYANDGRELSYLEQLTDSVNITGRPIFTELLFPLGLRYHALHHLFPTLPYHNLGLAHRRLMAELPAHSPYRQTVSPSMWPVLADLWRQASAHRGARAGLMAWPRE